MAHQYPSGYSGAYKTWDEMMTLHNVNFLHPEVLRRLNCMLEWAALSGQDLGVGGGHRDKQPSGPTFAKNGNSWHQSCPWQQDVPNSLAIDMVNPNAWEWMYEHAGTFGFRTFKHVNSEPWHIQPAEIPASRNMATRVPPLLTWDLPGDRPIPPGPVAPPFPGDSMFTIVQLEGSADTWKVAADHSYKRMYSKDQPGLEAVGADIMILQLNGRPGEVTILSPAANWDAWLNSIPVG